MDSRIGRKYLKGALGYGGPCFPRDNVAFAHLARSHRRARRHRGGHRPINSLPDRSPRRHGATPRGDRGASVGVLGLVVQARHRRHRGEPGRRARGATGRPGLRVSVYDPLALPAATAVLGDKATRGRVGRGLRPASDRCGDHDAMAGVPEHSSALLSPTAGDRARGDRLLAHAAPERARVASRTSCTSATATSQPSTARRRSPRPGCSRVRPACTVANAAPHRALQRHLERWNIESLIDKDDLVVVTGGGGFIGGHLVADLASAATSASARWTSSRSTSGTRSFRDVDNLQARPAGHGRLRPRRAQTRATSTTSRPTWAAWGSSRRTRPSACCRCSSTRTCCWRRATHGVERFFYLLLRVRLRGRQADQRRRHAAARRRTPIRRCRRTATAGRSCSASGCAGTSARTSACRRASPATTTSTARTAPTTAAARRRRRRSAARSSQRELERQARDRDLGRRRADPQLHVHRRLPARHARA